MNALLFQWHWRTPSASSAAHSSRTSAIVPSSFSDDSGTITVRAECQSGADDVGAPPLEIRVHEVSNGGGDVRRQGYRMDAVRISVYLPLLVRRGERLRDVDFVVVVAIRVNVPEPIAAIDICLLSSFVEPNVLAAPSE